MHYLKWYVDLFLCVCFLLNSCCYGRVCSRSRVRTWKKGTLFTLHPDLRPLDCHLTCHCYHWQFYCPTIKPFCSSVTFVCFPKKAGHKSHKYMSLALPECSVLSITLVFLFSSLVHPINGMSSSELVGGFRTTNGWSFLAKRKILYVTVSLSSFHEEEN